MRWRTAGAVVVGVLLTCAGCGSSAPAPVARATVDPSVLNVIAFQGRVLVTDRSTIRYTPDLRRCVTRGSSRDVRQGAMVVVDNSRGLRVANGRLGPGRMVDGRDGPAGCSFGFDMSNAPGGSQRYTVRLGDRAPVTVHRSDIRHIVIRVP